MTGQGGAAQAVEGAARHYAHMVVLYRMRTPADRAAVAAAFERAWGAPLPPQPRPSVVVTPGWARLGRACIPRAQLLDLSGARPPTLHVPGRGKQNDADHSFASIRHYPSILHCTSSVDSRKNNPCGCYVGSCPGCRRTLRCLPVKLAPVKLKVVFVSQSSWPRSRWGPAARATVEAC